MKKVELKTFDSVDTKVNIVANKLNEVIQKINDMEDLLSPSQNIGISAYDLPSIGKLLKRRKRNG